MIVNPSTFAAWLQEAMQLPADDGRRQIIRIGSDRDFGLLARHISRQRRTQPMLGRIQPLRLIRAISCPVLPEGKLASAPFISSVETDSRVKLHVGAGGASSGKGRSLEGAVIPWGIRHIRAPQAWTKSKGDQIRIGVIDTGVDYAHPDLRHCLSRGFNVLNRQLLPYDDNGHGTHIAGTIAAYARQKGIIGVAPQALIHPVKAFDHQGGAFVSDIIAGIEWCVSNGIDIINMSFGMKTYSKALEAAVLTAHRAGLIIVASSGNEGKQAEIDYPARFRQVIAVGATTRRGRIASFSNAGKGIDIYAPGEKIYSTWLRGKYNELSGTSMATSHVSGVVALMLAKRPGLKPLRVKALLKRHARFIVSSGKKIGGIKELHALRAVAAVSKSAKR
ncbi:peptidase S8 and S53, subtilisin, kexin, sedolisin [Paenibacillus mucilaginosus 3016]|uniref:Peptidase S8 and S53, subtilisin, kexin, sedolisin n=1 Tax=Paenibacillus mucilaginosus 3016 TaxID=1116391 RepID=H6NBJ2_9BACL|nr:S8 family peptidase [Paenibacillus mucilaginosus]AFC33761.1 peptidase S8 and S53, subtilisin, kexin, sedolisin [Paenibacillus mucilaginosus 3016]WFA22156.1 peptidase S8 [Paenibacillus mucilaginosus]